MSNKLSFRQVKFTPIQLSNTDELSDKIFRKCGFCEKSCQLPPKQSKLVQKLAGPECFYCPFCLRHNLNNKDNRDVLILSFRSIIGYFYLQNYLYNIFDNTKFWISEIEDYIKKHMDAGLTNPVFLYDPDSLLWFIDFSKVGRSKKKIPIEDVFETVANILKTFDLEKTIAGCNQTTFFSKYKEAIDLFYTKRHRPENRKKLIPTLTGCGVLEPKNFSFDCTRDFIFEDLAIKK
jgi:hypothetical protein